jgi:hypothetical protein
LVRRRSPWHRPVPLIAVVIGTGLAAFGIYAATTGSSGALAGARDEAAPVSLQSTAREGINRVVLSARAVERLGIQTAPVRAQLAGSERRIVIPYSALVYGPDGDVWTYTSPTPRTFVRARVSVARIDGDLAVVSKGPRSGTRVVTVGAEELFGSEIEFAED